MLFNFSIPETFNLLITDVQAFFKGHNLSVLKIEGVKNPLTPKPWMLNALVPLLCLVKTKYIKNAPLIMRRFLSIRHIPKNKILQSDHN